MDVALEGLSPARINELLSDLDVLKENLRDAIQKRQTSNGEQRYG